VFGGVTLSECFLVADVVLRSVPAKVLNVHVTHVDSHMLSIAWDSRDDVTLYEIRHWEHRDVTGASVNVTSSSNFTLLRLAHDTQYSFQVASSQHASRHIIIRYDIRYTIYLRDITVVKLQLSITSFTACFYVM